MSENLYQNPWYPVLGLPAFFIELEWPEEEVEEPVPVPPSF